MKTPDPVSSEKLGLNDEVFAFIAKLLPAVDLINFAVVVWFSTRPWLTLAVALCFPIVGVGGIQIAKRLGRNIAKPQMLVIVLLHLLICSISGARSPAWLMCIPGLVASIFLLAEARYKIGFLFAILVAAGWGNYLSGKDDLAILTATAALAVIAILLFRTHQFLNTINVRLEEQKTAIEREQEKSRDLLLNILPAHVIAELSGTGKVKPARHEETTTLFADLSGFTQATAIMPADRLVAELNDIFVAFDAITREEGIEKIKTIGDAYMAVAGLFDHRADCGDPPKSGPLAMLVCGAKRSPDHERKTTLDRTEDPHFAGRRWRQEHRGSVQGA